MNLFTSCIVAYWRPLSYAVGGVLLCKGLFWLVRFNARVSKGRGGIL